MGEAWQGDRLFVAGIAVVIGLLLGAYVPLIYLTLFCIAIALLCLLLPSSFQKRLLLYSLICILAILYFHLYDYFHQTSLLPLAQQAKRIEISGVIDSPVKRDGDVVRFFVLVESCSGLAAKEVELTFKERVALQVKLTGEDQLSFLSTWREGNPIHGNITLSIPDSARNPYVFDYARYLRWQAVYVTATASFEEIRVNPEKAGTFFWFEQLQTVASEKLEQAYSDQTTAGFMKSLLLGVQEGVTPELQTLYSDLGLIHVLAISGLHVTLVSGLFLWLLERTGMVREKALLVTMVMIACYVLLVGASASAVRSGMMGIMTLLGHQLRRKLPVQTIWSVALLVMLLYNPYQLWHIGFQLSFAVTLGLLVYVPLLMQSPFPRAAWLRGLLSVTVAAQLVSFPFIITLFHQFSPLSWLVNLFAVPILSLLVLPAGYIGLIAFFVHPALAVLPCRLVVVVLQLIHPLLEKARAVLLPFTHWPHPTWIWLCAYGVLLAAVPLLWRFGYRRRRDVIIFFIGFIVLFAAARQPFSGTEEVRITFLDVGQGDSIVVEIGKKTVYLIDGGGTLRFQPKELWRKRRDPFEVGKDVLLPFLRGRGIASIDRLVLTHGDFDHVGGIPALIPYFHFRTVVVNGQPPDGTEADVIHRLQRQGVPVVTGKRAVTWSDMPSVHWTWLHPGNNRQLLGNDASVVLLLTAFGVNILLTGDLEKAGEEELIESGLLPSVDVLKVGHHGSHSSTSDSFLQKIRPKAAVISVGRNNTYGHPSLEVLERLKNEGAVVFRTDLHGAITLTIRPEKIFWETEESF